MDEWNQKRVKCSFWWCYLEIANIENPASELRQGLQHSEFNAIIEGRGEELEPPLAEDGNGRRTRRETRDSMDANALEYGERRDFLSEVQVVDQKLRARAC